MEGNRAVSISSTMSSSIHPYCVYPSSKAISFQLGCCCYLRSIAIDSSIPIGNRYPNMNDIKTLAALHIPCELGSADSGNKDLGSA
jgi:hypothetical protein